LKEEILKARFADSRVEEVHKTGISKGLPRAVSRKAWWMTHLLVAAYELGDLLVMGSLLRLPGSERLAINVQGKWHLTFAWSEIGGASEIKLERR
jgi:hypothetical protein